MHFFAQTKILEAKKGIEVISFLKIAFLSNFCNFSLLTTSIGAVSSLMFICVNPASWTIFPISFSV